MKRTNKIYPLMLLVGCGLVVTACGGKSHAAGTTGDSSTTGSTAAPLVAPLTGLPQADAKIRNRPLLAIKIDNAPEARPQFGLQNADDIMEEKVEGGLSRFMALYQSQDADQVGPVRSLRSTDAHWLKPEGGMIAYSGGIPPFEALLGPAGITDLGADSHGATYYKRLNDRAAPHNYVVNTTTLRTLTPAKAPPAKPLFTYLGAGQTFGGAGVAPVSSVSLTMSTGVSSTSFDWTWNSSTDSFMRGTDGKPHLLVGGQQIAMTNVIVQFTNYSMTPYKDPAGTEVDEADTTGSGDAWFLSDGKIVVGHWSRPTDGDITTYTDSTGAEMKFQPGHTWISLVPPGQPNQIRN